MKKTKKPALIELLWSYIKEFYPIPAKAWVEDGGPEASPPERCKFWLAHDHGLNNNIPDHPGYCLYAHDPVDVGWEPLVWDGEAWV